MASGKKKTGAGAVASPKTEDENKKNLVFHQPVGYPGAVLRRRTMVLRRSAEAPG
jgi:hypothetical protein